MGLMSRRRRPIARLAAGAATAGVAYKAGKRHEQQDSYNEQASAAYDATQTQPAPTQYAPPPPAGAPASSGIDQLNQLVGLHTGGVLSDEEFSAAKAKLLGM